MVERNPLRLRSQRSGVKLNKETSRYERREEMFTTSRDELLRRRVFSALYKGRLNLDFVGVSGTKDVHILSISLWMKCSNDPSHLLSGVHFVNRITRHVRYKLFTSKITQDNAQLRTKRTVITVVIVFLDFGYEITEDFERYSPGKYKGDGTEVKIK